MTDNRTTERVDHPPRVRDAIDELMRKKDATDNRTTELLQGAEGGGRMSEYIYGSIGDPLANVLGEIYLPRAEVVRCRDCKYADISYTHAAVTGELHCYGYLVESWDWYNDMPSDGVKVKPDNFCAWAEKRTDE